MDMRNVTGSRAWEEMEGVAKAPHHRGRGQFLIGTPSHYIKREPEEGALERWEAQLQEFLRMLQAPNSGCRNLQISEEPSAWEDAKAFLASFEQVASACRWPQDKWVTLLLPALSGDLEQAFSGLSAQDKGDYRKVKAAILQGEAIAREKQRQHFRQLRYREAEGPRGVYGRLRELCGQWLKIERHTKDEILELLILEQLLSILPGDMQSWVREQKPESCAHAVALAEEFLLGRDEMEGPEQKVPVPFAVMSAGPSEAGQLLPQDTWAGQVFREAADEQSDATRLPSNERVLENETNTLHQEDSVQGEASNTCLGRDEDFHDHQKRMMFENQPGLLNDQERSYESSLVEKSTFNAEVSREERESAESQRIECSEVQKASSDCRRNFERSSDLMVQQSIHIREKPYLSFYCGNSVIQTQGLLAHERTHTGLWNTYNYSNSGKNFSCSSGSMQHMRIHTGESLYTCSHCGKNFVDCSVLQEHVRLHTLETPYKCSDCGKSFDKKRYLNNHVRKHRGEKPYECLQCGKSFPIKSKLVKHEIIHMREMPYKCALCGKTFVRKSDLCAHEKIHTAQ
ncbi:zinc finger and SCAN domain-containing protein 31-like [Zootoca vivipara]|uniref:zinc finger and SCAN domain-containing protein 31-like n=1 Tax=Zootoca vivipara TaxID=8524 RepID=UPI001591B503|nr:zinc finger and SCAN domain-containing protein 31-like [Zootoca vivipara]XP_034963508.1 zinc finger and SCAN domain-containing protein 31-like [Zootoca vivipara]XP_034963509.1 zinc finger and SCAN domain-containing protein 31-like [Zootoca vivipara]